MSPSHKSFAEDSSKTPPRILSLKLKTHALSEQRAYYRDKIGFPIVEDDKRSVTFQAGDTLLRFEEAEKGSVPFYHFAFNIPENKILEARKWQLERGALMFVPERLRDPNFPDDVVNFSHWNAHSVFFFDPAGNVVEYIARHDLKNSSKEPFGVKHIQYASEIAFVVDDVESASSSVKSVAGVGQYRGGDDQFRALGDEKGLLLVFKRGRHLNFRPDSKEKLASVYPTSVVVSGNSPGRHQFEGFPYELSVQNDSAA